MKEKQGIGKVITYFLTAAMLIAALPFTPVVEPVEAAATANPVTYNSGSYKLKDVNITGGTGQSAVTINGDVTLTIEGTVTLTGGNAGYEVGAGAGIEVPAGSSLTLKGNGTLITTGGNGSNGENGLSPESHYHIDPKDKNSQIYTPNYSNAGRGGGGAGTGIGSKGADKFDSIITVGNINISDKQLQVKATGGKGGNAGGKGGKGGEGFIVEFDENYMGSSLAREQYITAQGGYGGGGGGGAGYPAAGIGSGGAAGSHGGAGSQGGRDQGYAYILYTFILYLSETGWWTCGGGSGGGSGRGYVNGGGGGGGAVNVGSYNAEFNGYQYTDLTYGGKGGNSGQAGAQGLPESKSYKDSKATSGGGGGPNGAGTPGIGHDSIFHAAWAGPSGPSNNQGNSGNLTINAGTVSSISGGTGAQDIGAGAGLTSTGGSLIIRGGSLDLANNNIITPTDGKNRVYPVTLSPSSYNSESLTTDVLVNDKEWGVNRFSPQLNNGLITIWLPNGKYTAKVANLQGIYDSTYNEFTVNNASLVPKSAELVKINLDKGPIVFTANQYTQNGTIYNYNKTAILTGGASNKPNLSFQNTTGEHNFILQDGHIGTLNISDKEGSYATVILQADGTSSTVDTIKILDHRSKIKFIGEDTKSELNIKEIQGAGPDSDNTSSGTNQKLIRHQYEYISDLYISVNKNKEKAKQVLLDKGYSLLYTDLNQGVKGSDFVYLGYKTSYNYKDAIQDLKIFGYKNRPKDNKPPASKNWMTMDYQPVPYYDVADLNNNAGGLYLYLYYSKTDMKRPINCIDVYTGSENYNKDFYNEWVYGFVEDNILIDDKSRFVKFDLNKGCGGGTDDIFLAVGHQSNSEYIYKEVAMNSPANGANATVKSSNADQHAGEIIMSSKGKVHVGNIFSLGVPSSDMAALCYNGENTNNFWGTPSLTVNSGNLILDEYLKSKRDYRSRPPETGQIVYPSYLPGIDPSDSHRTYWAYRRVDEYNYMGSNTLGSVTVNGGTLQIGSQGTGNLQIPYNDFGRKAGGADSSYNGTPVMTVKPGANLLANSTPHLDLNGAMKLEITGLPKNDHLVTVPVSSGNGIVGNYTNLDIWTTNQGKYTTYVAKADNGKKIVLVDEEGNIYQYEIQVINSVAKAVKVDLTDFGQSPQTNNVIWVYPNYIVDGESIYSYSKENMDLKKDIPGGIVLMDNTKLKMTSDQVRNIKSITGDGSLVLDGAGVNVTSEFNISSVTVNNGSVSAPEIVASIQILGGSVKSDKPLSNVQGADGQVYLAKLPAWHNSIKVNGKTYSIKGPGHGSDKSTYLYVSKDTKIIEAGSTKYALSYNETDQVMKVSQFINGNGVIDLTKGSAEIISEQEYIYNGIYYKNTNGANYTIKADVETSNRLIVSGGSPKITLDNVIINSKDSVIDIKPGFKVELILKGTNTLITSENGPAIHVPEKAALTISGTGKIKAAGSINTPAIGGGANEKNGKITINGGTLDLVGTLNPAVGAGGSQISNEGSIVINGGSIKVENTMDGSGFSVTPQNNQGQELSQLTITPDSGSGVKVDGKDYYVSETNDDGNLHLYVVSGKHTVKAGNKDYQVVPLRVEGSENGSITLYRIDQNGEKIKLNNGEMVVEGSKVYVNSIPQDGYGLKNGPATGTYIVKAEDDELILYPLSGTSTSVDLNGWQAVIESSGDDGSRIIGFEKEITAAEVEEVSLGAASKGTTVVTFKAKGEGMKLEIAVNGKVVKTAALSDKEQEITYEWQSNDNDEVKLRLSGAGKVFLSQIFMSSPVNINKATAEFDRTVTLDLVQPNIYKGDGSEGEKNGFIQVLDSNGKGIIDRNPGVDGIQLFAGEKIKICLLNYGGSVFDYFIVSKGSSSEQISQDPMDLTINEDITISAVTHLEPYYVTVIPETVELDDKGVSADIKVTEMKNIGDKDSIEVKIKSGLKNGTIELKRTGADNTLSVALSGTNSQALNNGSLVARFNNTGLEPIEGGKVNFGKPEGDKKAGRYTGRIDFEIEYKKGG